jgi:hypothetical protein
VMEEPPYWTAENPDPAGSELSIPLHLEGLGLDHRHARSRGNPIVPRG